MKVPFKKRVRARRTKDKAWINHCQCTSYKGVLTDLLEAEENTVQDKGLEGHDEVSTKFW